MNEAKNWLKRDAKEIFQDEKGINRAEVHQKVAEAIVNFFDESLKQLNRQKRFMN